MKKTHNFRFLFALLGAVAPLWMCQAQTTFFSDNFTHGSTTNQLSVPGGTPTASFTSYDIAAPKNATASTVSPNLLHLALNGATTSGFFEAQALFTTNPVSLNAIGDYIEIDVVFTNTTGTIFTGTASGSSLWLGLFNSDSVPGTITNYPVSGAALTSSGLTAGSGSAFALGNCGSWQGYVGQILSNSTSHVINRPIQNGVGTTSANQDLLGNAAGTGCFGNPGATFTSNGGTSNTLINVGGVYTLALRITLSGQQVLTISNSVFQGPDTTGPAAYSQVTTNVSGTSFLTGAFDGMGIGLRSTSLSGSAGVIPIMDISSILITGQSTIPTTPPTINVQPVNTTVTTNGSCAFSVTAIGQNVQYQWFRNVNQKLSNGGNISGATSSQLIISPATTADQFTGVNNGYYCICTQGSNLSTNTTTNTLTLINSTNLTWVNGGAVNGIWDVNNNVNWQDASANPSVFNFGDPVTFDDTGTPGNVNLSGNYISPSQVTVNTVGNTYIFQGSGSIAGPCSIDYIGSGRLAFNGINTFTGGTLVSNVAAYVFLQNYAGLGSGPVTLGKAGGQMELVTAGSATSGIQGNIVVADDFTMLPDTVSTFAAVFLGTLSGTSGKTLTISPGPNNMDTNQIRIRLFGANSVYNGNLNLTDPNILFASYHTSGTQTFNGNIIGTGGFMEKGVTTIFNSGNSTYSGGTTPAQGAIGLGASSTGPGGAPTSGPLGTGPIILNVDSTSSTAGNGFIFATINNLTLANSVQYASGTNNQTLDIGGSDSITLTGPFTLYCNYHTAMTAFPTRSRSGTNTGQTTLTGVISDNGSNYNFNLTGSGVTLFNNTEAYGGTTTNSGGTLLVNGQIGPAAVVALTNAATAGGSNAIAMLGGSGTITGPVSIQAGGTLTSGSQTTAGIQNIGTLTVNNSVTFLGGSKAYVLINKTASTHSLVNVSGAITYNGTLVATNISGTPVVGDHFTVFSAGSVSGNFTNIVGTPGPGLAWSFTPASGVLSVITGVTGFTIPPGITNFAIANGTNLVIGGTNGQANALYYLLSSTNLLTPKNQWTPVGTNTATGSTFLFNVTNAVNPKFTQQFYLFSNQP